MQRISLLEEDTEASIALRVAGLSVEESEFFTSLSVELIANRIAGAIQNGDDGVSIRCARDSSAMSADEKQAEGANSSLKMDRAFWNSLTDIGRIAPDHAAASVLLSTRMRLTTLQSLVRMREAGIELCRFRATCSPLECSTSARLDGMVLRIEDIWSWPPNECASDQCLCLLMAEM